MNLAGRSFCRLCEHISGSSFGGRLHTSAVTDKMGMPMIMAKMAKKQEKIMKKMTLRSVERDAHRKPAGYTMETHNKGCSGTTPWTASYMREHEPRRVKMVESLLMDRITELLSTDAFLDQLRNISVEITGVQINKNSGQVNIMWYPTGDEEKDRKIFDILTKMAPDLREELCSQHVLGYVPRIEFMRDKTAVAYHLLQAGLAKADFGPPGDYESDTSEVLQVTIEASPTTGVSAKVAGTLVDPFSLDSMPELRTDAAGLNRKALMEELINVRRPVNRSSS